MSKRVKDKLSILQNEVFAASVLVVVIVVFIILLNIINTMAQDSVKYVQTDVEDILLGQKIRLYKKGSAGYEVMTVYGDAIVSERGRYYERDYFESMIADGGRVEVPVVIEGDPEDYERAP